MRSLFENAHQRPVGDLLDDLRIQGKRIFNQTLRSISGDREASHGERLLAWQAVEEAAEEQLRRWDYFNHPELK